MKQPPRLEKQYFFDDEMIDVILNAFTDLTAEVSVIQERLDTVERVLDEHGVASRDLIEAYQPDPSAAAERAQARMQLIRATLDPFRAHLSKASRGS